MNAKKLGVKDSERRCEILDHSIEHAVINIKVLISRKAGSFESTIKALITPRQLIEAACQGRCPRTLDTPYDRTIDVVRQQVRKMNKRRLKS